MENYTFIDTDAAIGSILSNFSSEYINHTIDESLNMRFRPFNGPMPNMVDVLERNFNILYANSPDYIDQIKETRRQTYIEIVNKILSFYNLNCVQDLNDMDPEQLHGLAHLLYDVFVSRFTENMINFFIKYILDNSDAIYSYLKSRDDINRPKDVGAYSKNIFTDEKFILIYANINLVIYNLAGYDIPLELLIKYFYQDNIADTLISMIEDNGDIYKNYYACYLKNSDSPELITRIKLGLQSETMIRKSL